MKRTIMTFLVTLLSVIALSQTSSGTWNNATATYTNVKHGITWTLIEGLDWIGRPILTESTLLKVRNDDNHIMVTLGVQRTNSDVGDIWDYLPMYNTEQYLDMAKAEARRNDMVFQYVKAVKSQLCGKHANKIKTVMTKYYSEYKTTIHSVNYQYQIVSGGYVYTLGILGLSVREDELADFDRIVANIINGFIIK
jgi:hypothetical protein